MVPAGRFGAAVLLAEVHASEYRTADEAAPVHQARTLCAASGRANPSSDSIWSNVRTTVEA